jgi:uncharacterized protein involved in response to NO
VIALFVVSALAIALTAGFGLGLWLLLARTLGLSTGELPWLALVQVHGTIQLFGFAGMFLMGVALHVLPRFRGAPPTPRALAMIAYATTVSAILLRAVTQPVLSFPGRPVLLPLSGLLLAVGTTAFAIGALRALRGGTNAHRPDELVMAAGVVAAPIAAILFMLEFPLDAPGLLADQGADDRAVWTMLLVCLATTIIGVWARLAPGFTATPPSRPIPLLAGGTLWFIGAAGVAGGVAFAPLVLFAGLVTIVWALGVFGAAIARQALVSHARLTRLAVRSAFVWALVGSALLVWYDARNVVAGPEPSYLESSAARHAFALGFVTLMIFGVAARALPSFLGRRLWNERLQLATLVLANAGVALRVIPEGLSVQGDAASGVVAASGALAYGALVLFAVNVLRTVFGPNVSAPPRDAPMPIAIRLE